MITGIFYRKKKGNLIKRISFRFVMKLRECNNSQQAFTFDFAVFSRIFRRFTAAVITLWTIRHFDTATRFTARINIADFLAALTDPSLLTNALAEFPFLCTCRRSYTICLTDIIGITARSNVFLHHWSLKNSLIRSYSYVLR